MEKNRVITLKQPWATLVAEGIKKYEFRSWKYNYRGKLLIHAGAGVDKEAMEKVKHLNLIFPKKKIVAEVNLVDCIELDNSINKQIICENPLIYSQKERTGYAWKLEKTRKIESGKEISGKQGIWYLKINDY